MSKELIKLNNWEKAKNAIAECKDIDEVKKIRDKAEALRAYAKQAGEGLIMQNNIADVKIRAERRIGEFSKDLPTAQGKYQQTVHDEQSDKTSILKDAGIKNYQRYEAIANLPEEAFEEHIKVVKESNKELTTLGLTKLAKDFQREEKKDALREEAKNYKENPDIQIIHGDFRKQSIKAESIDLVLTDPPYPKEYLPLWQDLFIYADKVLKPSGFLVAYSGQMYLDKIFQMPNDLIYYWTMSIEFTRKPIVSGRNMLNNWKPILIFQKAPFKKLNNAIIDKLNFEYTERDLHDKNWGQTIQPFEYLLEKFSNVGDTVLEPFAGTGTTLIACKNKKRKCIGVEIDKQYIDIIKGRLND